MRAWTREDRLAALEIGVADRHLTIEPARPEQRGIEDVLAVGRRDDDDALVVFEAIHLDEELVERLLALFVAERVAAAAASDGVELVDEDDAGLVAAGVAEQASDPRGADAGIHLDEIGTAREHERHASFASDRTGEQRLAGPGRADEQYALGNAAADGREASRLAQEVDDLLDLVFRLVHAGDILERDDVLAAVRDARAARGDRDPPGSGPVHGERQQREERGGGCECAPAQRPRLGRGRDLELARCGGRGREGRSNWRSGTRRGQSWSPGCRPSRSTSSARSLKVTRAISLACTRLQELGEPDRRDDRLAPGVEDRRAGGQRRQRQGKNPVTGAIET